MEQQPLYDILMPGEASNPAANPPLPTGPAGQMLPPPNTLYNGQPLLRKKVAVYRCPSDVGAETNQFVPVPLNNQNADNRYATSNYVANQTIAWWNGVQYGAGGAKGIKDILDGTTNTLLLAERALNVQPVQKRYTGAIVWGYVDPSDNNIFHANWRINEPNPTTSLYSTWYPGYGCRSLTVSSFHPGGAQFTLADGSVRFISETIATNPAANRCTGGGLQWTGPGMVYQNLYVANDGNPVSLD
jgi:prepilin-type processing-associated H-X9-DG protein